MTTHRSTTAAARLGHETEVEGRGSLLSHEAAARLRDLIVEGELPPGSRLNERVLCERFQVSRTPLREALKVLASEGLVELPANRAAVVADFTPKTIAETFEVLSALEGLAGELACRCASDAHIAEVCALHYEMRAHHARGELPGYFRCNQRIHEKIVEASGNGVLQGVYRNLNGHMRRARYRANLSPERWDQAVEEHEGILDALLRRDGVTLKRLLQRHLRNKLAAVRAGTLTAPDEGVPEAGGEADNGP